jgi:rhamnogalacturonyl hydrolase YesR
VAVYFFFCVVFIACVVMSLCLNFLWLYPDVYATLVRHNARKQMGDFSSGDAFKDAVLGATVAALSKGYSLGGNIEPVTIWNLKKTIISMFLRKKNHLLYSWPQAFLSKGLMKYHATFADEKSFIVLREYGDMFLAHYVVETRGVMNLKVLDQGMNGIVLLYLWEQTAEEKWLKGSDGIAQYLIARSEQEGGPLSYRVGMPGLHFVDALPMICPFLMRYGRLTSNHKAIDLAVRQLMEFIEQGTYAGNLPFHAYSSITKKPVGLLGWGRGTGFYACALVDCFHEACEMNHRVKNHLKKSIINLMSSVLEAQRNNGGWNTLLTYPDAPYDSSATVFLTYFLQRVVEFKLQPDSAGELQHAIDASLIQLCKLTRQNGWLDGAQLECRGLDYMSRQFSCAAYAQGMLLAVLSNQNEKQIVGMV